MDPKEYNRAPFPLKNSVSIETVAMDDPRVGLRGKNKVVATGKIKANQIVGIYEGSYFFQCEHDMDRTILNDMKKQYKAIDVTLIDENHEYVDVHRVKNNVFLKSGVRIQATLERDGYREFTAHMLIDAEGTTGPYAWASECNDFRKDPLKSVEEMYKIKSKDIDAGESANCVWVYVWIMVKIAFVYF
jgi:hypothetical protein